MSPLLMGIMMAWALEGIDIGRTSYSITPSAFIKETATVEYIQRVPPDTAPFPGLRSPHKCPMGERCRTAHDPSLGPTSSILMPAKKFFSRKAGEYEQFANILPQEELLCVIFLNVLILL